MLVASEGQSQPLLPPIPFSNILVWQKYQEYLGGGAPSSSPTALLARPHLSLCESVGPRSPSKGGEAGIIITCDRFCESLG